LRYKKLWSSAKNILLHLIGFNGFLPHLGYVTGKKIDK